MLALLISVPVTLCWKSFLMATFKLLLHQISSIRNIVKGNIKQLLNLKEYFIIESVIENGLSS